MHGLQAVTVGCEFWTCDPAILSSALTSPLSATTSDYDHLKAICQWHNASAYERADTKEARGLETRRNFSIWWVLRRKAAVRRASKAAVSERISQATPNGVKIARGEGNMKLKMHKTVLALVGIVAFATGASAQELKVGDVAPDFTLQASDGHTYTLSKLRGKTVVLAWFPKAFTGG